MTFDQFAIIAILIGMLGFFALERPRIETTALCGLGLAFLLGLVPAGDVFDGVSSPAVITVVEILIIVQVIGRAAFLDKVAGAIARIGPHRFTVTLTLCSLTALLSVFMNNIGAMVMVLPIGLGVARSTGLDPRQLIMPIGFSALLGGLGSVIGTPANLLVSNSLAIERGSGFAFFDFAYVGLPVAAAGILVIVFWSAPRLGRLGRPPGDTVTIDRVVTTEFSIAAASALAGATRAAAEEQIGAQIFSVLRGGQHLFGRPEAMKLQPGDVCVLRLAQSTLQRLIERGDVDWAENALPDAMAEIAVAPGSLLVGAIPRTIALFQPHGIMVRAIATRTSRVEGRLADLRISIGDVLYLDGERTAIVDAVEEAGALMLAPARRPAGSTSLRPFLFFVAGIAVAATRLVPPEIAFGGVIVAMLLAGEINLRSALADLDWPILIMLAAMIPLGTAVQTSGTADLVAATIIGTIPVSSDAALTIAMLAVAALITPFVNNASTAVILSPIALELSRRTGTPAEALLMAVAAGASIDFMTPFGHHNNTLAMSLGGYRFKDFIMAGTPLTALCFVIASAAIVVLWL